MDRNPSPPSSEAEEGGDAVGSTVYSKHWLFSILTRLIEVRTRGGEGAWPGSVRRPAGAVRAIPGPEEARAAPLSWPGRVVKP